MEPSPQVLDLLKALAHADRLKIVGVLTRQPAGVDEVARELSLPVHQVFNHLSFLEFVGVVHKQAGRFVLDADRLEKLARSMGEASPPGFVPGPGTEEQRARVLAACLSPDGTIRRIPNSRTQETRFRILLEYLVNAFEVGVDYTERQVNSILAHFHEDVSGLRRDLVDRGLLARERDGSRYWRVPQ